MTIFEEAGVSKSVYHLASIAVFVVMSGQSIVARRDQRATQLPMMGPSFVPTLRAASGVFNKRVTRA